MAMQADSRDTPPEEVLELLSFFVKHYYQSLHATPDQAYKFYKDSSTIGRAGSDGVVEYVTTLPEIKKNLMSMDFSKYLKILIHTVDGVPSLNGGVRIVVTGSLTMSDGACQKFNQSFFLAPIEGGYFVQSDILRIMPETSPPVVSQADNHQNEIKQDVGSIAEPREVERVSTDHVSA
ncbi:nuclear transport factor 2 [Triticum aestivum]|uniref:nuclear transport factor 2 n=1 Tax=Triticum aestivum TaxID=4565 RepID=UPI00098BA726|nr:nuclear transport factor 2-like [Aegilops tauschii subsp. strangulata]XP_044444224.1 nuclear transport factor 2-like [Triticum aestivum]